MNLASSAGPQPEAQSDSGYVLPPFSSDPTVVARRGAQTPHQTPSLKSELDTPDLPSPLCHPIVLSSALSDPEIYLPPALPPTPASSRHSRAEGRLLPLTLFLITQSPCPSLGTWPYPVLRWNSIVLWECVTPQWILGLWRTEITYSNLWASHLAKSGAAQPEGTWL